MCNHDNKYLFNTEFTKALRYDRIKHSIEKYCKTTYGAHRMCGVDTKETYLEILYFRQFYKHFVFVEDEEGNRKKRLEKYLEVSAVVDVGCGDTKESN